MRDAVSLRARIERSFWSADGHTGVRALDGVLHALSLGFEAAAQLRNRAYDSELLRIHPAGCPTVCVGNPTVGGSGKTPVVGYLAEGLAARGERVAILNRGYGGRHVRDPAVVTEPDAARFGDEASMLASRLAAVDIVVGADRVRSAALARARGATVLLMDDGFQHRRLARDVDVVVVDGSRGLGNGFVLPRGPLRESASCLRRADLVLLKRGSGGHWDTLIEHGVRDLAEGVAVLPFRLVPLGLTNGAGSSKPVSALRGKRVFAVSGIGHPAGFLASLDELQASVVERLEFPDHHAYLAADLQRIQARARAVGADAIVTTAKDLAKIGSVPADDEIERWSLDVGVEVDEGVDLVGWVLDRARDARAGRGPRRAGP